MDFKNKILIKSIILIDKRNHRVIDNCVYGIYPYITYELKYIDDEDFVRSLIFESKDELVEFIEDRCHFMTAKVVREEDK